MDSENLGAGRGSNQGGGNRKQQEEEEGDTSSCRMNQEKMSAAEAAAWNDVLLKIHPTVDAEEHRADVTNFVENLITKSFNGVQVFPYGSVPLKTYLPSGDIDLTVICKPEMKNNVAHDIYALLKNEEFRTYGQYQVKDTKLVDAEVKLVKCNVGNIAVDISFNQLGGLSAVCFLEQVDRIINKDHVFKLSILLIKAWCHCESHILGAYQGLLSTYALESLILCIFQLFGSSLNGPLAVLYRFLDYYSRFDWTNCCISLDGPVHKWSLPDLIVTDRQNGGAELLLSGEALTSYMELFSASSYSVEKDERRFPMKSFNIVDPLKGNNNLGRSVNKANCSRLIRAFKYGARQLGRILEQPREAIPGELQDFFQCTLKTYGSKGTALDRLSSLSLSDLNAIIEFEGARRARYGSGSVIAMPVRARLDMIDQETSGGLLDLTGDYTSQARGYAQGRCCLGYSSRIPALCRPPLSIAQCLEMIRLRVTPSSSTEKDITLSSDDTDHIPPPVAEHLEPAPVQETLPLQREAIDEDNDKENEIATTEGGKGTEKTIDLDSREEFPPLSKR